MADILEFAKKDSVFSVGDVLEDKISALLARMHDYKAHCNEEDKQIIESWRNDLVRIRSAVYVLAAANTASTRPPLASASADNSESGSG